METITQQQTIAITYREICAGKSPWIPLGMFMHDFFGNFKDCREELVRDPIIVCSEMTAEQQKWAAFCAASVEYLCEKYSIACPEWTRGHMALPEPMYEGLGCHKPQVQERLRMTTPEPFARRNIYCGDRVFANKYEIAEDLHQRRSA